MSAVLDDVAPLTPEQQLVLDEKVFPIAPLKVLAREGAIGVTFLDLTKGDGDLSYNAAEKLLAYLGLMHRSISWWIGDALLYVESAMPDEFSQIIESLGLSIPAAKARMFVCQNVPVSRRKPNLGFSIHDKVARLSAKEQSYWLDRADKHGWSYAQLCDEMKAKRKDDKPPIPGVPLDAPSVIEAARRVVSAKQEYGADWLVPREAMAVLIAALGEEEDG